MNIDHIINDIENLPEIADRCIFYSEVILYLKDVKANYYFIESSIQWKNDIRADIIKDVHDGIDNNITKLKEMIKLNVNFTKLI